MFNEKKFKFDIENLKQDLAIEDMYVTEEDISLLRDYKEQKITEQEREALLEEEKRLLYVAVSRAKEKLMLLSENELNDLVQPLINKPYVNHYKGNR